MTGGCTNGAGLFFFGYDYYINPVIQQFTAAGVVSSIYMTNFPGLETAYDTAWLDGGIWIARDNADSPIIAYNTDGLLVGNVEGTTVSAAMGLTVDDSGYIWASNPDNDIIYQIEVTTTDIEGGSPSPDPRTISVSRNPFYSSVVITSTGFNNSQIGIFDLTGRILQNSEFTGSFVWNAVNMPQGSYFAVISDELGSSVTRLTKIN